MVGWIEHFFKKRPDSVISKKKLIAEFALSQGSTERTGKEIISLLEQTGKIKIEGDNILKS